MFLLPLFIKNTRITMMVSLPETGPDISYLLVALYIHILFILLLSIINDIIVHVDVTLVSHLWYLQDR